MEMFSWQGKHSECHGQLKWISDKIERADSLFSRVKILQVLRKILNKLKKVQTSTEDFLFMYDS
jgi:hypothetical protein